VASEGLQTPNLDEKFLLSIKNRRDREGFCSHDYLVFCVGSAVFRVACVLWLCVIRRFSISSTATV